MPHLLVTNDFPPKIGGIQTYLWELWRRLPPDDFAVLTTAHPHAAEFDAAQPFRVERVRERVLLPTRRAVRTIDGLAAEIGARFVVLDPGVPIGLAGPRLSLPYVVVMHGSESVGRVPVGSRLLGKVIAGAEHVIAAGGFPQREARRLACSRTPAITVIPPGIDVARFTPLDGRERRAARRRFGLPEEARLVVGVSRLVPRKGFDVAVDAVTALVTRVPDVHLAIGGAGRDRGRLQRRIDRRRAPATLLGRVPDEDLPSLYACADVFAMVCRTRWAGVEPEGFGIVFLEAAACGVPQVAGDSGGAADAVVDGETGLVVRRPREVAETAAALERLLADRDLRASMGAAARTRVLSEFSYDHQASRLAVALASVG